MSAHETLEWTGKLIALAVFLQTLEFWRLRPTFSEKGFWKWSVLRQDFVGFPKLLRTGFDVILSDRGFAVVLIVRFIFSAIWMISPGFASIAAPALFVAALLTSMRWRGTFNGGSDGMTLTILLAASVAALGRDSAILTLGSLWFIAVQACLSFFVAGVVKIRQPTWRNGLALQEILRRTNYDVPLWLQRWSERRSICRIVSWSLMIFELCFPLALLSPQTAMIFIVAALGFQIVNFHAFGLNRFVFAWAAAYPAIFFGAGRI